MIGYSENNSDTMPLDAEFEVSDPAAAKGITTSRQEHFRIEGTSFYKFNKLDQSAIFTCSQCFFSDNEDPGRTTFVTGLIFDDATVTHRLRFQTPFRDIVFDEDGSLTGSAKQTVAAYWKHLEVSGCTVSEANTLLLGGILCD